VLGHDQLYIDIGASDKAAAERLVRPGDFVAFDSDWVEFGDGMVKTPALDDRVGCYTMLRILENEYDVGVACSFSVQEEVGLRGAGPARFNIDCDYGIALEGTASNDLGVVDDHYKVTCVGKGVAISFMDRTSIANVNLFADLRDVGALLQRAGFALPVTDVDRVVVRYANAFALMQDIRRMGAANVLIERRRTPSRRSTLLRMAEIYAERFADADGRIRATFDIIWLSGWAPHASQQQPLKPGSAKASLAEAVKKAGGT
jgi:hypothetical protein